MCPVNPTTNQDVRQAKNRKRGDAIKKKSYLKLLRQSQPNFAEMILGWSPSKSVSEGPLHQSVVAISPVVSEEKIFM
jgi:hypothetical protein